MENQQQRTRRKNCSVQDYIEALEEVKHQINLNPKVKTSRFASEFGFSKVIISDLKKIGVIKEIKHKGVFWLSEEEINETFVHRLKNFMRQNNKINTGGKKITGVIRGKQEPKKVARQKEMKFDQVEVNIESIDQWKERIKKQVPDVSDIKIQEPIVDQSMVSEFIDHHVEEIKQRTFEIKIFGIKLFTLKY
jgi:hypothetical protein